MVLSWDKSLVDDANPVGDAYPYNYIYKIRSTCFETKSILGDQPFLLKSIELKYSASISDFRKFFFQCVSNSSWAHEAHLVIAAPITDDLLRKELQKLGNSFGVGVTTFNITEEAIDNLPPAQELLDKDQQGEYTINLDEFLSNINKDIIQEPQRRTRLDWTYIDDIKITLKDFRNLFDCWIGMCLHQRWVMPIDRCRPILNNPGYSELRNRYPYEE